MHERLVKKNSAYGSLFLQKQGSSPSFGLIITILFVNSKVNTANLTCSLLDLLQSILYQLYKRIPSDIKLVYCVRTLNLHDLQPVKMKSLQQILRYSIKFWAAGLIDHLRWQYDQARLGIIKQTSTIMRKEARIDFLQGRVHRFLQRQFHPKCAAHRLESDLKFRMKQIKLMNDVSVERMQGTFTGESALILVQPVELENHNEEAFGYNAAGKYNILPGHQALEIRR